MTRVDCKNDPIGSLKTMFVDIVQEGRIRKGQCPALRPVFLKAHGTAHGRLIIREDLPSELRIGIFAGAAYPAWVRFSSDTVPTAPDFKTTVGLGIKLFDVPGPKLIGDADDTTADLILQNHDRFFVDTAADMCAFTKAGVVDGDYGPYLAANPQTDTILGEMAKPVVSLLTESYWSILPFAFGEEAHVKYRLEPAGSAEPIPGPPSDPTYLSADLASRLSDGEQVLRLSIQQRTDPASMPLDAATVRWDEAAAPWIHVADLVLDRQDIHSRGQADYGENLAMNIWRVPAEHAPVGSIAEARKLVYAASADRRRDVNGIPAGEPATPRPAEAQPPARDMTIVSARIHPGIGIARVGDSADEYFVGPEVVYAEEPADGFRDDKGALKRQAARFRIFGYNAAGEIVRELTSANASIRWTAHLANSKADWYRFQAALDIPDAKSLTAPRRNKAVKSKDRGSLVIDPGSRSITGADSGGGPEHRFDGGQFKGKAVGLGELRTDDKGRLLVLGGHGVSASPSNSPLYTPDDPDSFNNADDWYDDIADGPVTAEVSIAGRPIEVTGAWVAVAPPNYGSTVLGWRTLYDLLVDTYVEAGWIPLPARTSFSRHVLPMLQRLSNLQWVNKGFAALFGHGAPLDFDNPDLIARLAQPRDPATGDDPFSELRARILGSFRPFGTKVDEPRLWPWIYGDAYGSFAADAPANNLSLGKVQSILLERWAAGDFDNDWIAGAKPPRQIDDVALAEQPAMLDQAALHFCLADAFHPGCELTWPMRHISLYSAPFRIKMRPSGQTEPGYGPKLTQEIVLAPNGPLFDQGPGTLSRWMALPWQGDTAFCRSGYDVDYDPYLPSFWAARVPNQVLTEEQYHIVMDESRPRSERLAAFHKRDHWLRSLTGSVAEQMAQMIDHFGKMGLLESRLGPQDDADFPQTMMVEILPPALPSLFKAAAKAYVARGEQAEPTDRVARAGWESQEQLEEFRSIRIRNP